MCSFESILKTIFSDEVFNNIPKELNNNGSICEMLDKFFEYTNKHRKIIEHEYDSQFIDYGDNDQEERTKYINNKYSKLPIHEKIQKLNLNHVMMDFDATSSHPSATWDKNSVNPKRESGFVLNQMWMLYM